MRLADEGALPAGEKLMTQLSELEVQRRERVEHYRELSRLAETRSSRLANLRGLAFLLALFAGGASMAGASLALSVPALVVATSGFIFLVVAHARTVLAGDVAGRWFAVSEDALARVTGQWRELPQDGARFAAAEHPYAADLDLFGRGSLFQRLSVAHTWHGREALAKLLLEPSSVGVALARQELVRELAARLDARQGLEVACLAVLERPLGRVGEPAVDRRRAVAEGAPNPEVLLRWAESAPSLWPRRWLWGAAGLLPVCSGLGALASWQLGVGAGVWLVPFLVQLVVVFRVYPVASRVFATLTARHGTLGRHAGALGVAEDFVGQAPLGQELHARLVGAGGGPRRAMRGFERAHGFFELRHNALLHPVVNLALLWDLWCVLALERWQVEAGRHLRSWFEVLGELEALSSLAGLSSDDPQTCWPELQEAPPFIRATGLTHPLIDPVRRVANDLELAGPGRAVLVTGSNMSGKSTLLRSLGLAAVLAQAGAPVCAERLCLGPLHVRTSLRISDSLERGVSHFYAELAKLAEALGAARAGQPVLFLLDEILHGTNSEERGIGARWVIAELLEAGAIGIVSTHDLALCELAAPLMQRVTQCHLRESVEGGKMTFDYRLRPGPVAGGNALRLMRSLGLEVPLPVEAELPG